jgi:general secretion pathway protein C
MAENILEDGNSVQDAQLPLFFRFTLTGFEIFAVILLAILCSDTFLSLVSSGEKRDLSTTVVPSTIFKNGRSDEHQYSYLKTVDPFYGVTVSETVSQVNNVPQSTLDIQIFGLRAKNNGSGTVILKSQGGIQKLAQVGDEIASGAKLTAIFANRIEFRRNGRLETIYLPKDRVGFLAKKQSDIPEVMPANNHQGTNKEQIADFVSAMDLTPYRQGKNIEGFTVGVNADLSLLSLVGLQKGDIINSVNGNRLHSWERVKEISEGAGFGSLDIQFERSGEPLALSLSQSSLGS